MITNNDYYETETILDAETVSQILQISRAKLYSMCRAGQIPCWRLPNSRIWKFSATGINEYIRKNTIINYHCL